MNGLNRLARGARSLVLRFVRGTRGNVAMMFALALPALLMISLGAVDIHQASKVKAHLQDALDAAALAAARSKYTDDTNLNRIGLAALKANMPAYFHPDSEDTASFTLDNNKIVANARVNVKVLVANIVLPPYGKLMDDYLPVGTSSEVLRASRNVEVAMALDITGSMAGQKLKDLKAAANELIDIVVQTEQTPFYSKVALAPYSIGVNVDTYANALRGAPVGTTSISKAEWAAGSSVTISKVTRASTARVTANGHGLTTGDSVWIKSISNMSGLNDRAYKVTVRDANTFDLNGTSTTGYSKDGTNGNVTRCLASGCTVVVTSNNHKLSDSDYVAVSGVRGMTNLNATWQVDSVTANTFRTTLLGPTQAAYTSGGDAQCGYDGCRVRIFRNMRGSVLQKNISNCVTERPGASAGTDAAPGVDAWLGRLYPTESACPSAKITPLTSLRDTLKGQINSYSATGGTAGQIGLAAAWHLISPNFSNIWPSDGAPAAHDPSKTLKAVVLMTDGDFNTNYCQGVLAANAGYGDADTRINCNAQNGDPFSQSITLCNAMKRDNIVVYTVGFNLGTNRGKAGIDTAIEVMEECASSKDKHFFKAESGTDLKEAFKAIGRDITRLRIAR